eukprot:Skav217718  [mRNA]  locus=scaffold2294:297396:304385:- [translate_table: standard]
MEVVTTVAGLPRTMEDLEKLKALGVGAMVTLNEAWEMELSNRFVRPGSASGRLRPGTATFAHARLLRAQAGGYPGQPAALCRALKRLLRLGPRTGPTEAAVQFITAFVDQGEAALGWRAVKRFCRHFVRTGRRQEAFTNKPSNNPSNVSQPGDVSQRNLPTSPARSKCSGDTVRNVEKEDETSKREANCGEVTAKPQDLAAASQSCSQQQEEIGPAQDESMPEQSPKLSCGETSAGLISGDDPPPAHVAIDAEPLAPLNAPQPHALPSASRPTWDCGHPTALQSCLMPSDSALAARVLALEQELAELRVTLSLLQHRLADLEGFEVVESGYPAVSTPAAPKAAAKPAARPAGSIPEGVERNTILDQTGDWLLRASEGDRSGSTGRDLLPGPSRYYLILRDFSGTYCGFVLSPWSAAVCC